MLHGKLTDGKILVKRGRQVQKFWKYGGYGVAVRDLEWVHGVEIHSRYDGRLYAPREKFYQAGIVHNFNGEEQMVLPVKHWEILT